MATTRDSFDGLSEYCDTCENETLHQISVQMRTESTKNENAQFSREPYRVAECQRCGDRSSQRMNDM
jgi:ribosomal protein L44E